MSNSYFPQNKDISQSFYHLRNWENLAPTHSFYVDYSIDITWIYQNLPTDKVRWAVWDGGYDGYNIINRGPYKNLSVYHYDATDLELNFIRDTFNDLDEHLELDFEQVNWGDNAEIYIWLVDDIEDNTTGYSLIDNADIYGNVETLVDVTDGIGGNYTKHTIVHELGHAIGLSHPGINGEDSPYWDLYTSKDTIMSYNSDANGDYGTKFTDLDIKALQSIWGSEGSYGGTNFDINQNSPVLSKEVISSHSIGTEYELSGITDYDGNLHANPEEVSDAVKTSYKYQGLIDVNADGTKEAIYTNKESGRWVTGSINSPGEIDYSDHGSGGTTRVVGIYIDPLVTSGEVIKGSDFDSQRRFQNDLEIDNLSVKASGDYDGDGFQEVYWKTNDGTAYLRALMHADGNIQYANYQSEEQMSDYLTSNGFGDQIFTIRWDRTF